MRIIPLAVLTLGALAALLAALLTPRSGHTPPTPPKTPCEAALEDCQRALDQRRDAERVLQCLVGEE